jgi:hypothetical protein
MLASIVIGDLHGKIEIAEYFIKNKTHRNLIFIGDYVDSFDRSIEDQYELLEMVLDAAENIEGIYALMGNHELSYLLPERYQASGYKSVLAAKILHLHNRMWKTLKFWKIDNGFLISHAGFHPSFIGKVDYRLSEEDKLIAIEEKIKEIPFENFFIIGSSRGGHYPVGGPLWLDWYDEFKNIQRIRQVVGHTARRKTGDNSGIMRRRGSINIDCLDRKNEVLWISNGKARKRHFELPRKIIV